MSSKTWYWNLNAFLGVVWVPWKVPSIASCWCTFNSQIRPFLLAQRVQLQWNNLIKFLPTIYFKTYKVWFGNNLYVVCKKLCSNLHIKVRWFCFKPFFSRQKFYWFFLSYVHIILDSSVKSLHNTISFYVILKSLTMNLNYFIKHLKPNFREWSHQNRIIKVTKSMQCQTFQNWWFFLQ